MQFFKASFSSLWQPGRIQFLDGLRAMAILLVVLTHICQELPGLSFTWWHTEWLTPLYNGWVGVDLFFVLSGFLVGSQIFKNIDDNTFSFKNFYARRLFRILPAYFFVIFLVLIIYPYLSSELLTSMPAFDVSWPAIAKNLLFVTNYWNANLGIPSWSLSIEEQFYILVPILLYWGLKRSPQKIPIYLFQIATAALIIRVITYRYFHLGPNVPLSLVFDKIYFPFHTRMDSLALGVLVASLFQQKSLGSEMISKLLFSFGSLCVGFVLLTGTLSGGWYETTIQYTLVALGFSSILAGLLGIYRLNPNSKFLPLKFLSATVWSPLARISYSIYLTHLLSIRIITHYLKANDVEMFYWPVISLTITVLVALPLFIFIEQPFHHWARKKYRLN